MRIILIALTAGMVSCGSLQNSGFTHKKYLKLKNLDPFFSNEFDTENPIVFTNENEIEAESSETVQQVDPATETADEILPDSAENSTDPVVVAEKDQEVYETPPVNTSADEKLQQQTETSKTPIPKSERTVVDKLCWAILILFVAFILFFQLAALTTIMAFFLAALACWLAAYILVVITAVKANRLYATNPTVRLKIQKIVATVISIIASVALAITLTLFAIVIFLG